MKFVVACYELVAMSSPAPPSAVSCCIVATTCSWSSA